MSEITEEFNNGQSAQFNRDVAKIFLGRNTYDHGIITNNSYSNLVIPAGQLVGRHNSQPNGAIAIMKSGNSDGSQFPCGIAREDHVIEPGDYKDIYFCTGGDVAEEEIIFNGSDDMNTIVSGRTYRDRIAADTVGIKIVRAADELTGYDNDLE